MFFEFVEALRLLIANYDIILSNLCTACMVALHVLIKQIFHFLWSSKHIHSRFQFLVEQTFSCYASTMSFETYPHKTPGTRYP